MFYKIGSALCDLVPFAQFKKREKHPWRVLILVKLQASAQRITCVFLEISQNSQETPTLESLF